MDIKKRINLLIIIGGAVCVFLLVLQLLKITTNKKFLIINNTRLELEIARTSREQQQGLSDRKSLDSNKGMLFVYSGPATYQFWMNRMNFALDFLWIEKNEVVDISENVPPPAQTNNLPVIVQPKVPVRYILEVNSGWVKTNKIKIGDTVELHI